MIATTRKHIEFAAEHLLAAFGKAREARWMRGASEGSDEEYSKYFAGATERATKQTLAGTLSPNAASPADDQDGQPS